MPNPMENIAAKAAAKAAAVGARAKGLTGVFSKLAEQHTEVKVLLKRAESLDDVDKRQDLWATIRRDLLSHERAEIAAVYPALDEMESTRDIVARHNEEAETLEATIAEIDLAGSDSEHWKSLMQRLTDLVKHHVDEEENEFFPRAQETIGKDKTQELAGAYSAAQERIMEGMA